MLSALLQHGCGTTGFAAAYGYTRLPLRTFPSSGGLQAPEVYLSAQAVEGVDPGIYHYHPVDHKLELIKPGNHGSTLRDLALDQPWVETASVVMIITGFYERLRWKYQARGYRFMCMDAGFLAENICLSARALSLGACAIAGFIDDALETLLGIDGEDEVPLLLISVGTPGMRCDRARSAHSPQGCCSAIPTGPRQVSRTVSGSAGLLLWRACWRLGRSDRRLTGPGP